MGLIQIWKLSVCKCAITAPSNLFSEDIHAREKYLATPLNCHMACNAAKVLNDTISSSFEVISVAMSIV